MKEYTPDFEIFTEEDTKYYISDSPFLEIIVWGLY